MIARYRQAAFGLACGLLFAAGLVISGMSDPGRVLGFLDFAGKWDPRLAFVMLGAVGVHLTWLRLSTRAETRRGETFSIAPHAPVTKALIGGAALFGIGWGMSGYCPGPAVVSLGLGAREGSTFFLSMLAGMAAFRLWAARKPREEPEAEAAEAAASCR
jgi:uncharacterized membrane protein YedE/YeeE